MPESHRPGLSQRSQRAETPHHGTPIPARFEQFEHGPKEPLERHGQADDSAMGGTCLKAKRLEGARLCQNDLVLIWAAATGVVKNIIITELVA